MIITYPLSLLIRIKYLYCLSFWTKKIFESIIPKRMDKKTKIAGANRMATNSMAGYLDIKVIDIEDSFITATMPVNEKTMQPMGILHGGASVVLAETLGSIGSALKLDLSKQAPVGLEINANHIRSVVKGKTVTGKANIIHQGRKTHVWNIEIKDEMDKLVCVSRLTVAIIATKP